MSYRGGHAHVRIEQGQYQQLKVYFLERALHRSAKAVKSELQKIQFEPYAPVRRQLLGILQGVNQARKQAGYELLGQEVFRLRRRVVRVFEPELLEVWIKEIRDVGRDN